MIDKIEFFEDEEWTAYYLNGKLQGVGDHYHAREWLESHFGVEVYQTDDFYLGRKPDYDNVAQTVAEIDAYQAKKDQETSLQEEAAKRAEINRLLDRIAELES